MATTTRPRIPAEHRSRVRKKSELKYLRRTGQIPAVIYGHGEPETIKVQSKALTDFLRHHAASGVVDLALGTAGATPALIRELDRDPITGRITHLGFQRVDLTETIKATIPLVFVGEEELIKNDLVLQRQTAEIEVHARADALPDSLTIDVSHAEAGHSIRIADLDLPDGVEPTADGELPVATITLPSVSADVEAALDAEEVAHAEIAAAHGTGGAEGEGSEAEAAATA